MPSFWVVIPARYGSTRLPAKPLLDIAGKPLIQHVYENALHSRASKIIIATDDERIMDAAEAFGATVCLTAAEHASGTDRVAEVVQSYEAGDDTLIVNLQGDEPLLPSQLINQVAQQLHNHPHAAVATLCEPLTKRNDLFNPHNVKVVMNTRGDALYFSRAPIPWLRDTFNDPQAPLPIGLHYRHIGIYAYRAAYLQYCTQLPVCDLERGEALEQLRIMYNGGIISVAEAQVAPGMGVDTPEDLEQVRALLAQE